MSMSSTDLYHSSCLPKHNKVQPSNLSEAPFWTFGFKTSAKALILTQKMELTRKKPCLSNCPGPPSLVVNTIVDPTGIPALTGLVYSQLQKLVRDT